MGIADLKRELPEDSNYQRYKSIRATAARMLPYEKLCGELDTIMSARQVRAYSVSNLQPRELLVVSMDEVSHRARATEILIVAKRSRYDLSTVLDAVWTHIAVTYSDHLKDIKTKTERDAAVTSLFRLGYELLGSIDSLVDQCECIIKDIDQCSFSLTRAANLFELVIRRENISQISI